MSRTRLALLLLPLVLSGLIVAQEKTEPVEKRAAKPDFALRVVHRENHRLVNAIEANKAFIPEGYTLVPLLIADQETGEVIDEENLLVQVEDIITGKDFQWVRRSPLPGEAVVKLTKKGGQKLEKTTRKLKLGRDRIAVVFEDRALIAPTVQAVLTDSFVVNGLVNQAKLDHFIETLSPGGKK